MKQIILLVFIIVVIKLNAQQVHSIESGDWSSCLTWSNQLLIGAEPPLISSKNKVTVSKTSNTWEGLTLEDGTSELIIEPNTTLNVRTTGLTQSLNMDNCPTSFSTNGQYTIDKCIPLWGNTTVFYPSNPSGSSGSNLANDAVNTLVLATILVSGHYVIKKHSTIVVTLPSGTTYGVSCPANEFHLQGTFRKQRRGSLGDEAISNPIVVVDYSDRIVAIRGEFPNCIDNTNSPTIGHWAGMQIDDDLDLGQCLPGDKVLLQFESHKKRSNCGAYYGSMRGLSSFVIEKID